MKKGYLIHVKDYEAEIIEFQTLQIYEMPDGTKKYFCHTKYGDEFFYEGDLHSSRSELQRECDELNGALRGANGKSKSISGKTK